MPQIATMIQRGILQKGDKKTVNGVRCREWLVTMKGAPSGLEHDTVCLGLEDHLPYEMTVDWLQLAVLVLRLQRAHHIRCAGRRRAADQHPDRLELISKTEQCECIVLHYFQSSLTRRSLVSRR